MAISHAAAAERLHLDQSTVSAHLARLEELVGHSLVSRSRGHVVPTAGAGHGAT